MHLYIYTYLFLNKIKTKHPYKYKIFIQYTNNEFIGSTKINFFKSTPLFKHILPKQKTTKLLSFLSSFFFYKNVLFMDYNHNYNYLPINNGMLFSRSFKKLSKIINYFDVGAILYFNLNNKKYVFRKVSDQKIINISLTKSTTSKKFDLSLNFSNTEVSNYMLYLLVLNIYLKVKNNLYI